LELKEIYAPVSEELQQVTTMLRSVGNDVENPWLAEQLKYIIEGSGKIIRPALVLFSGKIFDSPLDRLLPMAVAVELMHTATLIHDDAIDKADTRRGRATINSLWGNEIAILMGDYLFARAGVYSTESNTVRAIRLFSETLSIIASGEISQFRGAYNLNQSREEYFRRIYRKTGSLFSLSTQSGAIIGGAEEEHIAIMREYGENCGIAFQIVDDIMDFTSTPEKLGKPVGSDLRQGTLTLPAMMVLERYPDNNPVRKLFETKDESYSSAALDIILNSSIIPDCYAVATEFRDRGCNKLSILPKNSYRRSLEALGEFIINQGR